MGRHDNFYELGGHSLLATRLISELRTRFDVAVPLQSFFEEPTVANLAGLVARSRAEPPASAGRAAELAPLAPRRADREGPIPVSPAQERLWFLDQMEPGNPALNLVQAVDIDGRLDAGALARALGEIERRHEVLRTRFGVSGGVPFQLVSPPGGLALPRIELAALDGGRVEREARRLADLEPLRPFDLGRGPLVRACLLRLGRERHRVLLAMHHIISDGWSFGVLIRELAALYAAFRDGLPSPLPELPVQYADYALWQRERLASGLAADDLAYWRPRLTGAPVLELPLDRPRPRHPSWRGAQRSFALGGETAERLYALCRAAEATPFMALLALFAAVLGRYAGQDDVVIGSVVANRNRKELEPLIGFFVNTLVLRNDLAGDPGFRGLLARTRRASAEAYAHQELPFARLVEELQPARHLSRTPLFQVMLVLQQAPLPASSLPELTLRLAQVETAAAQFDLLLEWVPGEQGLAGHLQYSVDLFDAATVLRLSSHLKTLLAAALAEPDRPLSVLALVTPAERQQLVAEWNDSAAGWERGAGDRLHDLVTAQAARTPDAVAVVGGAARLTYGGLVARAGRLAGALRDLGIGAERRVGLCLPRTPDLIAAVLGILQAGGVYVPLDPAYPEARLELMLGDSGAEVLLTDSALAGRFPFFAGRTVLLDRFVDRATTAAGAEVAGEEDPADATTAGNLAYVIYTSGSTGRPKGVGIEHRSAVTLIRWALVAFRREELAGVLAATSVCFDLSIFEIFAPLAAGGRAILVPNVLALPELAAAAEVTLVNTVPSPMAELVGRPLPPGLRTVNLAGEPLKPELAARLYAHAQVERVVNLYGPSEDTTYSTGATVPRGAALAAIGRPLVNTRARVLGRRWEAGELLPIGVPGELVLAGDGLARGYLGRPELTAERFVPDPFGPPGARLYRTGDRARLLADGQLDFLGRSDHQIKIRGFRVELGEIEAVLAAHPELRQAVVLLREDAPGDRRLVAYVVPRQEPGPAAAALRAFAAVKLPEHMLPAAFVALAELPVTTNGKLDRAALPRPEWGSAAAAVAPRDPIEEILAGIWAEVLKLEPEQLGVFDDFFELGGHSLLATQVISRLRAVFGIELPVRGLFETPSIAGLAQAVAAARRPDGEQPAAPLVRREREGPLPLSFAQERLWFFDRLEPGSATYNLPYAVRLLGRLDRAALCRGLDEILRRHEALRTRFVTVGGAPAQVVTPAAPVSLDAIDLRSLPAASQEAELARVLALAGGHPFDITRAPLLRAALLALGEDHHVFFVDMHHIASDGWSISLLVRELIALYGAFRAGRPSPLPSLPVQYADFAAWQREQLDAPFLSGQLAYWRERLAGAPQTLELPLDRPRAAHLDFRGGRRSLRVGRPLADALHALARREGATPFMALLGILKVLLARHTGQRDVVVGTAVASRNRAEIEGLIGFFVNTLVLRTDLTGDPSSRELLARLRETALGAYTHQDLPFQKLVEELAPERTLQQTPFFQVMFDLHEAPPLPQGPGLRLEPVPVRTYDAKFDLTLVSGEGRGGLELIFAYNRNLFFPATVARLLRHFAALLAGMVEDPERPLSELPLLTGAERHQLAVEWTEAGWTAAWSLPGSPASVPALVEARAAERPQAVAVRFEGQSLTYRDLSRRSAVLARRLRGLGVGAEARVGLLVSRSADLVAAILGIWKAGGAYVALDPALPLERLSFMVEDALHGSRSPVLVADGGQRELLAALPLAGVWVVFLDELGDDSAHAEDDGRDSAAISASGAVEPSHLAYLIYTSGTTGRPKAVAVEHGSLSRSLGAAVAAFGFGVEDRMPCLAAPSFDIFLFEAFAPLLGGGTTVLWRLQPALDLGGLVAGLSEMTLLHAVPALMRQVVEVARRRDGVGNGLRRVFVGGDAVPPELLSDLADVFPRAAVTVLYGPTEGTIIAASLTVSGPASSPASRTLPGGHAIGRPLPGARVDLRDRDGATVPIGVPGELWLGGAGVTRGYLGRPELTAEKYVPGVGGRWYRTGDLARRSSDGTIEFLGRVDQQVKVRGFRVELGEIESALAAHPGVREAVVLGRAVDGEMRLVAYVVPVSPETDGPSGQELAGALRQALPDYMVPAEWVTITALPLTAHGKVDRRALAEVGPLAEPRAASSIAPRTPFERWLAELWREVLAIDCLGVEESFFALGGNSIQVAILTNLLQERLGEPVEVVALFEAPTIARLSRHLEARYPAAVARRLAGVTADGEAEGWQRIERGAWEPGAPLPLSFAQERLWFLDQLDPGSAGYNLTTALRFTGSLDAAALARGLDEIVRRHGSLRTTFAGLDGRPAQVVHAAVELQHPLIDLGALPEAPRAAELRRLAAAEASRGFDLARGPLLRAVLLRLSEREHAGLFTMHHIVSDAWSMGVLVSELEALCAAAAGGDRPPLPELPIQYADFALWQRAWLTGERLAGQLGYWREALAGLTDFELPADRPRPPFLTGRGGRGAGAHRLDVPRQLARRLEELGSSRGATLFMTLLAAWSALLQRSAGRDDVAVGTAVANRNRPEIEGLIGFFVNTLVLRVDCAGDPSFDGLLARVRRSALGAYAHQDLPFEKLVEELRPQRDASRTPLFQLMFALQSAPPGQLALPGVVVEPIALESTDAKFDMSLSFAATPDGLVGSWVYKRDLFDAATVARWAGHLANLLAGVAAAPGAALAALPLLSAAERQQLVVEWSEAGWTAGWSVAPGSSVPALVEAQAAERPRTVAVRFEGESLTYRDLSRRSAVLARRLSALGVGAEARVGLLVSRSADLVAAILGIWKAGGAYVALDPGLPLERLSFMVEDALHGSRSPVLVADAGQRELLASPAARRRPGIAVGRPPGGARSRRSGGRRACHPGPLGHRTVASRLPDLHVGYDGPAEGGRGRARQPCAVAGSGGRGVRFRRGGPHAMPGGGLVRHLPVRGVRAALGRRHHGALAAAAGARPGRAGGGPAGDDAVPCGAGADASGGGRGAASGRSGGPAAAGVRGRRRGAAGAVVGPVRGVPAGCGDGPLRPHGGDDPRGEPDGERILVLRATRSAVLCRAPGSSCGTGAGRRWRSGCRARSGWAAAG